MTGSEPEDAALTRGDPHLGSARRETARAKINLTLEIIGRRADGYHALRSLVAFSRFGDELNCDPDAPFSLAVEGPFAGALGGGNLIEAAAAHYARAFGGTPQATGTTGPSRPPFLGRGAFHLRKAIPVAAGLGGGSADAAAALRLLAGQPGDAKTLHALLPVAAELGADVPVCLYSRPAIMTGIGETLRFLPALPPIPILLVNPGMPLTTASVFLALNARPLSQAAYDGEEAEAAFASIDDVVRYAAARRNDLEAPAKNLLPVIGDILERLEACDGALLVRLSGSGPTCFALFHEARLARAAAQFLRAEQPGWWVQETVLG